MASKKSTPKLKKKFKNKTNEFEETENMAPACGTDSVVDGAVGGYDEINSMDQTTSTTTNNTLARSGVEQPVLPLPTAKVTGKCNKEGDKKRSRFWSFMTKKKMTLPKCSEVREEFEDDDQTQTREGQCQGHDVARILFRASFQNGGRTSSPVQSSVSHARRLSMGAGAGPTGLASSLLPDRLQLLQMVPSACGPTLLDLPGHLGQSSAASVEDGASETASSSLSQQMRDIDMGMVISSNMIGYPHLCFSRSMSSSSSGSLSSSSGSNLTDHSLTHGLVSTIYPQIDVIVPGAGRLHGLLPPPPMLNPNNITLGRSHEHGCHGNSNPNGIPNPGAVGTGLFASSHTVHTQVDYMHYLVPDLLQLTKCSFYWGVMDRYEAERLLENRPEGTFLVRDSAQEEFLFSVSFRRYGRSLHARIEQLNHKFSFDSHDLGVFASNTVCGLIEHYKDPNCCMFFEPMLTLPLSRTFSFSLQHLCRSVICSCVTYDSISQLQLPKSLHEYLKYYHYKQRICVRRFEMH